jgi:hypothetical protein
MLTFFFFFFFFLFFFNSLGPLVKQIKEENLLKIIDCLNEYASQQKNDELRGISSVGKFCITFKFIIQIKY